MNTQDRFTVEFRSNADYTQTSGWETFASDMDARSVAILRDTHTDPKRFRVFLTTNGKLINLSAFDENATYDTLNVRAELRKHLMDAETEQQALINTVASLALERNEFSKVSFNAYLFEINRNLLEMAKMDDEVWVTTDTAFGSERKLSFYGRWLNGISEGIQMCLKQPAFSEALFRFVEQAIEKQL